MLWCLGKLNLSSKAAHEFISKSRVNIILTLVSTRLNKVAIKISAPSLGKSYKKECVRAEEAIPSDQNKLLDQTKLNY